MVHDFEFYIRQLNQDVSEKQEFCDSVENYLYEAWGGCPQALYELSDLLGADYPYVDWAESFLEESSKRGYVPAMLRKAKVLVDFPQTPSDLAAGIRLLKKAAKAGSAKANNLLGDIYKAGKGVKKNAKRAKKYYTLAANNNMASNVAA